MFLFSFYRILESIIKMAKAAGLWRAFIVNPAAIVKSNTHIENRNR